MPDPDQEEPSRTPAIPRPLVLVVMGVSGSGKTTIGVLLAARLNWRFADADDFHSAANIAKMTAGTPLDDVDRRPWLRAIAAQIDQWRASRQPAVVTCSALKRKYRSIVVGNRPDVRIVYLKGDRELLAERIVGRHGQFKTAALLDSQFETLEEPSVDENAITVWVDKSPPEIVAEILRALAIAAPPHSQDPKEEATRPPG